MLHHANTKPIPVTSQCLAIVLLPQKESVHSGKTIFRSFVEENRTSFWNAELVETVNSLDFVGFMRPETLLVSGCEEHLECLRTAWTGRVLKPPIGYRIRNLGDIGGIEMQEVPQTQFVPLADVLCLVISQLNRLGHPAVIDTVADQISLQYPGMTVPPNEILQLALQDLGAEGKVYCMGEHHFISTPVMLEHYRRTAFGGNLKNTWNDAAPYHANSNGLNKRQVVCTRECQTGASVINGPAFQRKTHSNRRDQATLVEEKEKEKEKDEEGLSNGMKTQNRYRSMIKQDAQRRRSFRDKVKKPGFFARFFARRSRSNENKPKLRKENEHEPQNIQVEPADFNLKTFNAQFPPTEWLYDPKLATKETKSNKKRDGIKEVIFDENQIIEDQISDTRRFGTFPENLSENQQQQQQPIGHFRCHKHRAKNYHQNRLSSRNYYLSSSSECLNYGPVDPPEFLPHYADEEVILFDQKFRRNERKKKQKKSEKLANSGVNDSTLRILESFDSVENIDLNVLAELTDEKTSTVNVDKANEKPISIEICDKIGGRTSTPVGKIEEKQEEINDNGQKPTVHLTTNSDSAYSPSPRLTDLSNSSGEKFSSWSGSETMANGAENSTAIQDHTYMNLEFKDKNEQYETNNNDSTRFENISKEIADESVQSVHISNV